jgi:hypothetical protein
MHFFGMASTLLGCRHHGQFLHLDATRKSMSDDALGRPIAEVSLANKYLTSVHRKLKIATVSWAGADFGHEPSSLAWAANFNGSNDASQSQHLLAY